MNWVLLLLMARIPEHIRKEVKERARGICEYCLCQESFSPTSFSVEHIIPVSKGGNNDLNNLALSCQGCNGHKYNKTHCFDAASISTVPLFDPRKDSWEEHFFWNADFTKLLGRTPVARATIECLKLNRQEVINLRILLLVFGEHPPR